MSMILHGIEASNVIHINTLGENPQDIMPSNQHDVILANPSFGKERPEMQHNFQIKTGETAFFCSTLSKPLILVVGLPLLLKILS